MKTGVFEAVFALDCLVLNVVDIGILVSSAWVDIIAVTTLCCVSLEL